MPPPFPSSIQQARASVSSASVANLVVPVTLCLVTHMRDGGEAEARTPLPPAPPAAGCRNAKESRDVSAHSGPNAVLAEKPQVASAGGGYISREREREKSLPHPALYNPRKALLMNAQALIVNAETTCSLALKTRADADSKSPTGVAASVAKTGVICRVTEGRQRPPSLRSRKNWYETTFSSPLPVPPPLLSPPLLPLPLFYCLSLLPLLYCDSSIPCTASLSPSSLLSLYASLHFSSTDSPLLCFSSIYALSSYFFISRQLPYTHPPSPLPSFIILPLFPFLPISYSPSSSPLSSILYHLLPILYTSFSPPPPLPPTTPSTRGRYCHIPQACPLRPLASLVPLNSLGPLASLASFAFLVPSSSPLTRILTFPLTTALQDSPSRSPFPSPPQHKHEGTRPTEA
ncbi:hypothetical protein C7M84_021249 [Penaeus vannamei]|uniref:Uncharacterized protein n=1 Tax=Penaeus vannamei TaxID=6689 RepID=A0A3R7NKY4_PENVA|nr:hypothetical protein C7M84_021249 [Penaeus vannamei]